MANGVIELTSTSSRLAGRIVWESSSNGPEANSSYVAGHFQMRKIDGYTTYGIWTGSFNIGGNIETFSTNASINTNWVTLKEFSITKSHNDNGTGDCYFEAYGQGPAGTSMASQSVAGSQTVSLDTIPRYATITELYVSEIGINYLKIHWSANAYCDAVQYSLNSSDWINTSQLDFTISGLLPNTNYNIKIRVKRRDSQLWTESNSISSTTKNIATISEAPNINIGDNATIKYINPSESSLKSKILFIKDNVVISTVVPERTVTGNEYTYNFTNEEIQNMYNLIPNSNEGILRYVLTTIYDGSEYENYADRYFYVTNSNPIFNNFSFQDNNETTIALTGNNQKLIKGYSGVKVIINTANKAVSQNAASMDSYRLSVGTKQDSQPYSSSNEVELNVNNIDNNTITVYAIDSRGNSTSKSIIPEEYIDYSNIGIKFATINREDGGVGTNATLSYEGIIWNGNFGVTNNSIKSIKYYYKVADSTGDFIEGKTTLNPTLNGNSFSQSISIQGDLDGEGFNQSNSYNVKIIVEDELSTYSFEQLILGPGIPLMAYHKKGLGIGNKFDIDIDAILQVYGNIYNKGDLNVKGNITQNNSKLIPDKIHAGGSCNDISETCMVWINNSADCPADLNGINYGFLITQYISDEYICQIFADANSNRRWTRSKIGENWQSWDMLSINSKITYGKIDNQTITAGSINKIKLNQVVAKTGSRLTVDGNDIVIGAGVSKIKVNGNAWIESSAYKWMFIYKNEEQVGSAIFPKNPDETWGCPTISPRIITATEGDRISLRCTCSSAEGFVQAGTYLTSTYLTVEVIE